MNAIDIHSQLAETGLSRLVEQAEAGEEVVIARAGRPVARLVRLEGAGAGRRCLGRLAGLAPVPDRLVAPLTDEMLDTFDAA